MEPMHTMDRLSDTERHRLDVLAGKYVSAYNAILDNKYIPTVSIETQIKENPEILELYNLLDKASLAVIKKDGTPKNPGVFGIGVFGLEYDNGRGELWFIGIVV